MGRAFYFGTYLRPGHWLWDEEMNRNRLGLDAQPTPWKNIDGRLNPEDEIEGAALIHERDGWTALAFANRTDDKRPGSNSVFFFEESPLTFEEAVALAKARFPQVVERFGFEIVNYEERKCALANSESQRKEQ